MALVPGLAMAFIDQSVLPVALPTLQKEFKASLVELHWCINSYLLVTAVLVLIGGKISDRIGHRKTFIFGMLLFALSSFLCGISYSAMELILARILQGIGAAFMFPPSTALLSAIFPPLQRV